jgi:hypothetical protein
VNHPDVAPCLASLGRLKMFTGGYGAAEALNQRALAMSGQAHGPDHWRVAMCLDNLSEIRKYLGDLPEAEALARRALAIRELFGKNKTESYLGEDALEEVLRVRGTPRILHMATHGFFLEDAKRPEVSETEDFMDGRGLVGAEAPVPATGAVAGAAAAVKNPLLRSGIALAGANRAMVTPTPFTGGRLCSWASPDPIVNRFNDTL